MTVVGAKLATGRTSDLFAYGTDSVVKVLRADVPAHWAELEFSLAGKIHDLDLPTPEPRDLVAVDGCPGVVFERVHGPSMQSAVIVGDMSVPAAADLLCHIHQQVLSCSAPPDMPPALDRLAAKIDAVAIISEEERREARLLLERLPPAGQLLHGDLHPNNILLADSGPVIIDWYDASVGHPAADIARSKLLMRSPDTELERQLAADGDPGVVPVSHLPGATVELLDAFRTCYLAGMAGMIEATETDDRTWRNWLAVNALGRVAEQANPDDGPLLAIWRSRPEPISG